MPLGIPPRRLFFWCQKIEHQQKDFMNVRIAKKVVGTVGPMMQGLENRVMLSGNVTASVVSGFLVLKGDAASNEIVMTRTGVTASQIKISSGSSATTINGAAGPLVLGGVRGLKIQLGA